MFKERMVTVILSVLLTACVAAKAKGPKFSPGPKVTEDQARVYFYKVDSGIMCLNVYLDDAIIGCLKDSGYLSTEVNPGPHTVAIETDSLIPHRLFEYQINTEGGEEYFYRVLSPQSDIPENTVSSKRYNTGMESGYNVVIEVEEGQAAQELQPLNLSN